LGRSTAEHCFFNKTKLAGLVVLGSNGEFALLSHEEKTQLVAFVRKHLVSNKKIIAGTGCESTEETIALSNECAAVVADAALVVTPWYYKGSYTEDVLAVHFQTLPMLSKYRSCFIICHVMRVSI
jgi:4-hydroxy-2-oxoglutarate aldolase